MIPRKNQSCLYNGVPVTVIDVLHTFPTSYLIRSAEGRESIVDDLPSFSPAPLPDTVSEMERLQAENAQLRALVWHMFAAQSLKPL